ncbi:MAG: peptide-methionine (S)-S-oxide reductase MsrA [Candidatus Binataceae bacterium]
MDHNAQTAVFGGGCFWCTEAVFERLGGVVSVMPGYAGGTLSNPTYAQVCGGRTGHAEVSRVEYDPARLSFRDLLTVFFATHDPTSLNRQGADVGTEYRSVIFYTTEEQRREAESFIEELNASLSNGKRIVTEVVALPAFYPAENYHREYYSNNTFAPYCQVVIEPKLAKLHKHFKELLRTSAAATA